MKTSVASLPLVLLACSPTIESSAPTAKTYEIQVTGPIETVSDKEKLETSYANTLTAAEREAVDLKYIRDDLHAADELKSSVMKLPVQAPKVEVALPPLAVPRPAAIEPVASAAGVAGNECGVPSEDGTIRPCAPQL